MSCLSGGLVCVSPRIYRCFFFIVRFCLFGSFLRLRASVSPQTDGRDMRKWMRTYQVLALFVPLIQFAHCVCFNAHVCTLPLRIRTLGSLHAPLSVSLPLSLLCWLFIISTFFFFFKSTKKHCRLLRIFVFFLVHPPRTRQYVWRRFVVSVTAYWNGLNYRHADRHQATRLNSHAYECKRWS